MIATNSFETLVANLTGRVRRERVGNREYIVAPLTMLVPGVHSGSMGPIYYPSDEIEKSAPFWDGIVMTDGHLADGLNGRSIGVQNDYGIGFVQNPSIYNGRLKAEGWFDVERTRRINPDIVAALNSGKRIELSTGLRVDHMNADGIHNGKRYIGITGHYRPDHLAILTRERGACSCDDGCGVNNHNSNDHSPAGGALGRFPTIDWEAAAGTPTSTSRSQPSHQQQPSQPNYDYRDGPAGGALGPPPRPTY